MAENGPSLGVQGMVQHETRRTGEVGRGLSSILSKVAPIASARHSRLAAVAVLCRVLEDRSLLRNIEAAVPGAAISVVRLRVPLASIHARLRAREEPRSAEWYVDVAGYLVDRMEAAAVEDHVVDNDDGHPSEVAATVLRLVGWLP